MALRTALASTFATALIALTTTAAHAQTIDPPCESHRVAQSFAIFDETSYAFSSAALPDGRIFAVAIPTTLPSGDDGVLPMRVAIIARCAGRPVWSESHNVGSVGHPNDLASAALGGADSLSVRVLAQPDIGGGTWMRIGVIANAGEDFSATTEVVSLYRFPDVGAPTLAWTGIGSTNENRNGMCVIDHVVEFHFIDEHTLTRIDRASATPPRTRDCRTTPARDIRIALP